MAVFKEEASAIERVAKKQKQIYNDAADYGYPYNSMDQPSEIKELYNAIQNCKGLVVSREAWGEKGTNVRGSKIVIQIAWEIDEGMECGTRYTISYNKISGHSRFDKTCDNMVSIDIAPYRIPYKK